MWLREQLNHIWHPRGRAVTSGARPAFTVALGLSLSGLLLPHPFARAQEKGPENPEIAALEAQNRALEHIASSVIPAVVNVQTAHVVRVQASPNLSDPLSRQYFGDALGPFNIPREWTDHSLGSGVIISSDGYVVTNNHVVAGATEIQVQLSDGRIFKGKLIGTDPQTDVAVLQVEGKDLPSISWGESANLKVGDTVLAFGNPFGLNFTVTRGIVSAVGRSGLGIENLEDFIQTDAAINPGNSGGALVDVHGAVVGINTAIVGPGSADGQGAFNGIGLAIPADIVRHVAESLIKMGKVERGYLGVTVSHLSPALARQFHVPDASGALIQDVAPGSPADKAGLRAGDILRELNGQRFDSPSQATSMVTENNPGAQVILNLLRDGEPLKVEVTLGAYPQATEEEAESDKATESGTLRGIAVQNLTSALCDQLGLRRGIEGVVIRDLDPKSPAAAAGLHAGDVIQEINRQPVPDVKEFERLAARATDETLLRINWRGNGQFVVISPQTAGGS